MNSIENSNKFVDSNQQILQRRLSPTVWSDQKISSPFWAQYTKNGFLQDRLDNSAISSCWIQKKLIEILNSQYPGKIFERGSSQLRSQFDIHHLFPEVIQKLITSQILQQATHILGSEPVIYQSHVNFKNANGGGSYDWHSDFTYWREQDGMLEPRAISIVLPLDQHGPHNGGLQILKGSHLYYYPTELDTTQTWSPENILHDSQEKVDSSGLIKSAFLRQFGSESLSSPDLELGDYLMMDANSWHSSAINLSSTSRPTLFLILTSEFTNFDKNKLHYRPNYITCRKGRTLNSFLAENR
jgi:ectoine hydroxylase